MSDLSDTTNHESPGTGNGRDFHIKNRKWMNPFWRQPFFKISFSQQASFLLENINKKNGVAQKVPFPHSFWFKG